MTNPSEHPIIFQTKMIQAYQNGRKNQTRRTRGLELANSDPNRFQFVEVKNGIFVFTQHLYRGGWINVEFRCPYGKPGDYLWFKETRCVKKDATQSEIECGHFTYKADDEENLWIPYLGYKLLPSLFMPRYAARYHHIPIISIIPQRIQEITPKDVMGEGIITEGIKGYYAFRDLIKSIKGEQAWDHNFWFWRIEFPFFKQE
ncbi:MAG: hypothetical protein WC341_00530 [Bacteroidales bacterium]|jgi:hypothetical protein